MNEDTYITSTVPQIKEYFERTGFSMKYFVNTRRKEKKRPYDVFSNVHGDFSGSKIFALQFKAPLKTGRGLRWAFKSSQHRTMQTLKWIYYCLPDFIDLSLQNVSLHHCWFKSSNFDVKGVTQLLDKRTLGFCWRWGPFARFLMECRLGTYLHAFDAVNELEEEFIAMFLLDLKKKTGGVVVPPRIADQLTKR